MDFSQSTSSLSLPPSEGEGWQRRSSTGSQANKMDDFELLPAPDSPKKSPFKNDWSATWPHPSPEDCQAAVTSLSALHKGVQLKSHKKGPVRTVLDSLVRTILSQNTTDSTSLRAFEGLKAKFPTYEEVMAADNSDVEDSIRVGGLAEIKVSRIKTILNTLVEEKGMPPSMEYVRCMGDEEAKKELGRFKGVGPKTVACVLMFCLERESEFPVDTHVHHIAKRLNWVPEKADANATYAHLNTRVPNSLKYDLHVLLVDHGKRCTSCAKGGRLIKPEEGKCPLVRSSGRGTCLQTTPGEEKNKTIQGKRKLEMEDGKDDEKEAKKVSKGRKVKSEVKTEDDTAQTSSRQRKTVEKDEDEKDGADGVKIEDTGVSDSAAAPTKLKAGPKEASKAKKKSSAASGEVPKEEKKVYTDKELLKMPFQELDRLEDQAIITWGQFKESAFGPLRVWKAKELAQMSNWYLGRLHRNNCISDNQLKKYSYEPAEHGDECDFGPVERARIMRENEELRRKGMARRVARREYCSCERPSKK